MSSVRRRSAPKSETTESPQAEDVERRSRKGSKSKPELKDQDDEERTSPSEVKPKEDSLQDLLEGLKKLQESFEKHQESFEKLQSDFREVRGNVIAALGPQ